MMFVTVLTTLITTRRHGLWNAVSDQRSLSGGGSDARHVRVSHCGPKSPEKEVEHAPVVTILGIETLRNVEPGHAPCTRGVLVEAQLRSARLWLARRTRGP
jgi:hypothetical protein